MVVHPLLPLPYSNFQGRPASMWVPDGRHGCGQRGRSANAVIIKCFQESTSLYHSGGSVPGARCRADDLALRQGLSEPEQVIKLTREIVLV